MARKRPNVLMSASRPTPDCFTRIHGIGPIIEKRLHSSGIHTFAQLAALPVETVAAIIPHLSVKQIAKQNWIHQARKLASSMATSETCEKEPLISTSRQHYENFTFEFLFDEKNKTRRLQVVHIQSGDADTWTKWDTKRLIDFLARHTGVRLPYAKSTIVTTVRPKSTPNLSASTEQPSEVIAETTPILAVAESKENIDSTLFLESSESTSQLLVSADNPATTTFHQCLQSPAVSATKISRICLLEWKTFVGDTNQSSHNLPHDQAFDVNLTLDLTHASLPDGSKLDFTASLYAKKLGDGTRQLIGEMQSTRPSAKIVDLTIGSATLPLGLYRLEVILALIATDSSHLAAPNINTSFQGGIFQVY